MTIHDAERAMREFQLVLDEAQAMLAEGATGSVLDDTLRHAFDLLDVAEAEATGPAGIQGAVKMMSDRRDYVDNAAEWRRVALARRRSDDLRMVCIHEYAHAIVAKRFDVRGEVTIAAQDVTGLSSYVGHFEVPTIANPHARRMIGLAGWLAQRLNDDFNDTAENAWDAFERGEASALSDNDYRLAGRFTLADVADCLSLVRKQWDDIAEFAEREAARIASE